MRRQQRAIVVSLVVVIGVAALAGWMLARATEAEYRLDQDVGVITLNKLSEGRLLSDVQLQDGQRNIVFTSTFLGRRLVLNFWFSTCEPCRREFPVLVQTARQRPDLRFIGVNLRDDPQTAAAFMERFGATFENYFDLDGRLTSAMGVATAPVTLIVDEGGVIRRQLTGEVTEEILVRALQEVFPS